MGRAGSRSLSATDPPAAAAQAALRSASIDRVPGYGIVDCMISFLAVRRILMFGMAAVVLQAPAKSVWDGVYTDDQATRGNTVFMNSCATCHDVMSEFSGAAFLPMRKGQTAFNVY